MGPPPRYCHAHEGGKQRRPTQIERERMKKHARQEEQQRMTEATRGGEFELPSGHLNTHNVDFVLQSIDLAVFEDSI